MKRSTTAKTTAAKTTTAKTTTSNTRPAKTTAAKPPADIHLVSSDTPWGKAQSAEDIAPGITAYTTASHGGYFLNRTANAKVAPPLKRSTFNSQGLDGWYEEDCDWAIVVYTFPQYFSQEKYKHALESLAAHHSAAYKSLVALHH